VSLWIATTDVQAWLGADKLNQDSAASLAQVATDSVQAYIERDLALVTSIAETCDTNGTDYVLLNCWPIRLVTSVSHNGMTLAPAAFGKPGWLTDPVNTRKLRFPGMGKLERGVMNLSVVYTAGYDLTAAPGAPTALPGAVAQALRLTAAAIFNSQAADPNLASESTAGVFSGSFYATGVGAVPPGARSLLVNFMRASP
jgi:hypothetical protein